MACNTGAPSVPIAMLSLRSRISHLFSWAFSAASAKDALVSGTPRLNREFDNNRDFQVQPKSKGPLILGHAHAKEKEEDHTAFIDQASEYLLCMHLPMTSENIGTFFYPLSQ